MFVGFGSLISAKDNTDGYCAPEAELDTITINRGGDRKQSLLRIHEAGKRLTYISVKDIIITSHRIDTEYTYY